MREYNKPEKDKDNILNKININDANAISVIESAILQKLKAGELDDVIVVKKKVDTTYEDILLKFKDTIMALKINRFSNQEISTIFETKIPSKAEGAFVVKIPPSQIGLFIQKHLPEFAGTPRKKQINK